MAPTDPCKVGMDALVDAYQNESFYSDCPKKVFTLLRDFKIDTSNRSGICNTQGCWYAFPSVAKFIDNMHGSCTITDIATKKLVPADQINCTNPTPGSFTPYPMQTSLTPISGVPPFNPAYPLPSTVASPQAPPPPPPNTAVVIGAAAAVVVIILGAFVFWCSKRQSHDNSIARGQNNTFHMLEDPKQLTLQYPTHSTTTTTSTEQMSTGMASMMPSMTWTGGGDDMEMLTMWNLPPQDLELKKRLAEGAFGEVWLATYLGGNVAVKTLLKHRSSMKDVKVFIEEIKLMAKMADCPAIVQFVGVSFHRIIDIKLVTEFMGGGDLRSVLQASDDVSF
ncbi:hypothetical protein As57867_014612, partial [Aphanomyces stellatus]